MGKEAPWGLLYRGEGAGEARVWWRGGDGRVASETMALKGGGKGERPGDWAAGGLIREEKSWARPSSVFPDFCFLFFFPFNRIWEKEKRKEKQNKT